jgi:hypothetical protein
MLTLRLAVGAWRRERRVQQLIEGARAISARKFIPASTPPAPTTPSLDQQREAVALAVVNAGRTTFHGLPPLTALPVRGPEQPQRQKIDPAATAALVIEAGKKARGELPSALPPKGSVARQIVLAGMKARGEKVPDDD